MCVCARLPLTNTRAPADCAGAMLLIGAELMQGGFRCRGRNSTVCPDACQRDINTIPNWCYATGTPSVSQQCRQRVSAVFAQRITTFRTGTSSVVVTAAQQLAFATCICTPPARLFLRLPPTSYLHSHRSLTKLLFVCGATRCRERGAAWVRVGGGVGRRSNGPCLHEPVCAGANRIL